MPPPRARRRAARSRSSRRTRAPRRPARRETFSTRRSGAHASVMKSPLKNPRGRSDDVAGDHEAGGDLLPQHLHVGAEVERDVSRGRMRVTRLRAGRVRADLLLTLARHENVQRTPHEQDQEDAADELGERELPAEEEPQHETELEDEVRGRELERHRRREARALLEQRLRDRDRRIRARRRRSAEPGRERDLRTPRAAERALQASARNIRLHEPGQGEAEHERPPDLPRHAGGIQQSVDDPHTP